MKEICFIILHYNCFESTSNCIDSICSLENQDDLDIIVIDNNSVNDSYIKLNEKYGQDKIKFLHNSKNLGFSAANNIAYEYAKNIDDYKYYVFANNDVCFNQKNFVKRIKQIYSKSGFSVLGPDVFNPNINKHQSPIDLSLKRTRKDVIKTIILNRVALLFYPVYSILENKRDQKVDEKELPVKYYENVIISGSCLIFTNEFLREKIIPFWPQTFFYYEEYILGWWCNRHNKKIVFDPSIQIMHYHGVATETIGKEKKRRKFQMKNILKSAKVYLKLLDD